MSSTDDANAPVATEPPAPTPAPPDDADDLRGFHFRQLLRSTPVLVGIAIFTLAAGIAGAVFLGPAIGGAAALGAFLLALLIVFGIADSRAEDAFFQVYASQHGLELGGRAPLPPTTPLLLKGDDRYAERTLSGPFAAGVEGILALYTYEEETTDSKGNRQTNYYRYTVGLVPVPECVEFVSELYCQRKFGLRALEGLEDAFRTKKERVKLESEALDDKYEIFAGKDQDPNWLRQLFAPTFIVWMTDSAPDKFAFELVDGTLCCYVSGHQQKAEELDAVTAASAVVAIRLREEALE
ncbi:MAG TPA: hypothetical protein VFI03_03780 [Solirubrobacterales bacterium]|nr:hypothetical protein [Solirubrobacterales bacterium]